MNRCAAIALVVIAACGKDSAPAHDTPKPAAPAPVDEKLRKLEKVELAVPEGWTAKYDAASDKWLFETSPTAEGRTATARIERAPATWVASPDAYLAQRKRYDLPGAKAEIEKREGVKDGFALTVRVTPAKDPDQPRRETYVVRQLGSAWYQCVSEWVPDDAFRDQLVGLCKSLKL
jgi:hypothetical protein